MSYPGCCLLQAWQTAGSHNLPKALCKELTGNLNATGEFCLCKELAIFNSCKFCL